MSKDAGFVVPPEHHYAPSAPPSYEEAIQQAALPMPAPYALPQPIPSTAQTMNPPQVMPQVYPPQVYPSQGYPSHHGYPPQGIPAQHTLRPQEPATLILTTVPVGRERCNMRCPSCNASIRTETVEEPHGFAHACCCLLFFIGCCLCSCLPYCMDSCKTVTHRCPNCKANLGTFNPF